MNKTLRQYVLTFGTLAALSCPMIAADVYITPAGAGAKTGNDWANAKDATTIGASITALANGETIYLGSGAYGDRRFTISTSGTATARKAIVGVDTGGGLPSFVGIQTTRSYTTFAFASGASYWTLKDIKIEHRQWGVTSAGANQGLIIDGLQIRDIRDNAFSFTDADNLLIQNCRAARYAEIGFRFNHSCDNVTIKNSVADCSDTGLVDDVPYRSSVNSPVGFDFHTKASTAPPNTNILIEDCESLNNDEDTADTGDFEQGDGFKMEGSNVGVTIRRCRSYRNQDAAYDLKGTNQLIEDSYAGHSRYGFKLWYDGTLNNCIALGNSRQMTLATTSTGYSYTANYCTFHNTTTTQIGAAMEAANTVYLNNTLFTNATNSTNYRGGTGTWVLNNNAQHNNAANTANAPQYNNPVSPWYGVGTNYDNNTYGLTRGYNSTAVSTGAVISVSLADTSNALAAGDTVGAVPVPNWTTSTSNNQTLSNLVNDSGAATTADVTFSNTAFSYTNSTTGTTGNAKLMRAMRALSNNSAISGTVTQIPYAAYDVYVYWGGRTTGETVPATMTLELQQLSGGVYTTTQTKYIRDDNRVWDGTFDESAATTAGAAVDGQEYVVFRNVTTPEFRVRSTMGVRTGFNGFQIVEQ
jgi:hypothetical protein